MIWIFAYGTILKWPPCTCQMQHTSEKRKKQRKNTFRVKSKHMKDSKECLFLTETFYHHFLQSEGVFTWTDKTHIYLCPQPAISVMNNCSTLQPHKVNSLSLHSKWSPPPPPPPPSNDFNFYVHSKTVCHTHTKHGQTFSNVVHIQLHIQSITADGSRAGVHFSVKVGKGRQ